MYAAISADVVSSTSLSRESMIELNEKLRKCPPTDNDDHGNFHSGELIGWLERGLMLLFVVMSQYEAIGFLIAAKSILRFNEASSGSEKSEYVLTGTLLSLATALALGILTLNI